MKKTVYCLLVIATLLSISCRKNADDTKPVFTLEQADTIDDEDYQLYSLVLDSMFSNSLIIIKQQTDSFTSQHKENINYHYFKEINSEFDSTIIDNLYSVNDSSYNFDNNFTCENNRVRLITSYEIAYLFTGKDLNEGWYKLYAEYPNSIGLISFYRIAYNSAKNQALMYLSHTYGSLGGEGSSVYLLKDGNKWVIKTLSLIWIS